MNYKLLFSFSFGRSMLWGLHWWAVERPEKPDHSAHLCQHLRLKLPMGKSLPPWQWNPEAQGNWIFSLYCRLPGGLVTVISFLNFVDESNLAGCTNSCCFWSHCCATQTFICTDHKVTSLCLRGFYTDAVDGSDGNMIGIITEGRKNTCAPLPKVELKCLQASPKAASPLGES